MGKLSLQKILHMNIEIYNFLFFFLFFTTKDLIVWFRILAVKAPFCISGDIFFDTVKLSDISTTAQKLHKIHQFPT